MEIRQAQIKDLEIILSIFDKARNFMRKSGNLSQWVNGYPSVELIRDEINKEDCYVCLNNGIIIATFCFIKGNDPTYNYIENGNWLNEDPYAVIHRIASDGSVKGIMKECLTWSLERCKNIRVDTHSENIIMRHLLTKNGFTECGIIYVADGSPRIAFQRSE